MTARNPYPTPFLMSADDAARKIAALIERGQTFAVIPWQMRLSRGILRALPNWLYDRLFANIPRQAAAAHPEHAFSTVTGLRQIARLVDVVAARERQCDRQAAAVARRAGSADSAPVMLWQADDVDAIARRECVSRQRTRTAAAAGPDFLHCSI